MGVRKIEARGTGKEVSKFRLSLGSFKFLTRETKRFPGKKLRFTITWRVDLTRARPDGTLETLELGQELEGCLATVTRVGELIWTPPQTRSGSFYNNIVWNSPDLHAYITEALGRTKYVKYLGSPALPRERDTQLSPEEVDATLPLEVEV